MAGWNNSDRRDRLPPDWPERVRIVKERDGGQCKWRLPSGKRCPYPGTDVDHRRNDDNHSLSNLWLLCGFHHGKKTAREGQIGRAKIKAKRWRPDEAHPGALS